MPVVLDIPRVNPPISREPLIGPCPDATRLPEGTTVEWLEGTKELRIDIPGREQRVVTYPYPEGLMRSPVWVEPLIFGEKKMKREAKFAYQKKPATQCTECGIRKTYKPGETICGECKYKIRRKALNLKTPLSEAQTMPPLPVPPDALKMLLGEDAHRSYLVTQALELIASSIRTAEWDEIPRAIELLQKVV